jgi:orotidine-5'-phosphate decarboxylase
LNDGRSVAELMADEVRAVGDAHVAPCGLSSVGAVVGATKASEAAALRARMPNQVFLIPGYGAQGGTAQDVARMTRAGQPLHLTGVVVNASRSIIYAKGAGSWRDNVSLAAKAMTRELREAIGSAS